MTKATERCEPGAVSFAFNATGLMADAGSERPWKRATLIERAEKEFRRLHGLRPGGLS